MQLRGRRCACQGPPRHNRSSSALSWQHCLSRSSTESEKEIVERESFQQGTSLLCQASHSRRYEPKTSCFETTLLLKNLRQLSQLRRACLPAGKSLADASSICVVLQLRKSRQGRWTHVEIEARPRLFRLFDYLLVHVVLPRQVTGVARRGWGYCKTRPTVSLQICGKTFQWLIRLATKYTYRLVCVSRVPVSLFPERTSGSAKEEFCAKILPVPDKDSLLFRCAPTYILLSTSAPQRMTEMG